MMKNKFPQFFSYFGDVFVRYRRSDAGIMTERTGKNSPKDERITNDLATLKMRQVIFLSLLNVALNFFNVST